MRSYSRAESYPRGKLPVLRTRGGLSDHDEIPEQGILTKGHILVDRAQSLH
jgi:hypothetical protein